VALLFAFSARRFISAYLLAIFRRITPFSLRVYFGSYGWKGAKRATKPAINLNCNRACCGRAQCHYKWKTPYACLLRSRQEARFRCWRPSNRHQQSSSIICKFLKRRRPPGFGRGLAYHSAADFSNHFDGDHGKSAKAVIFVIGPTRGGVHLHSRPAEIFSKPSNLRQPLSRSWLMLKCQSTCRSSYPDLAGPPSRFQTTLITQGEINATDPIRERHRHRHRQALASPLPPSPFNLDQSRGWCTEDLRSPMARDRAPCEIFLLSTRNFRIAWPIWLLSRHCHLASGYHQGTEI